MSAPAPARAKQSLGQNFLIDPNLAEKIVAALAPSPGEWVLEIGPGAGALTALLLQRTPRAIAVEIDQRLLPALADRFGAALELHHADILKLDLTSLAAAHGGKLAVLGNLPYYLSTPILEHLLAHRAALSRALLVLQTEMTERCCATPGGKDYGPLPLRLALYAAPRRLFKLPAAAFRPRPKIGSTALRLDFTAPAPLLPQSDEALVRLLRAAFAQRRKTLHNNLGAALGKTLADQLLDAVGLAGNRRAEQLTPGDFVKLADAWHLRRVET